MTSAALITTSSAHPAKVYIASLAERSRRVQLHALDTAAAILSGGRLTAYTASWETIQYEHVQALRSVLASRYAPATGNRTLSAVKRVLREAWRLGLLSQEDYARRVDVEPIAGERLLAGRNVEPGELSALFAVCMADSSPAGIRDAALLAVLYAGGLRRMEVSALELKDYNAATSEVRVREGKRRKEREVYVESGAAAALGDWLRIRGDWDGSLFTPLTRGGGVIHRPLSAQAVYGILERRAGEAKIPKTTPHDLRRSLVGDLLASGADLSIVADICGHANTNTTRRYDRRPKEARRQAVQRLHVPYVPVDKRR